MTLLPALYNYRDITSLFADWLPDGVPVHAEVLEEDDARSARRSPAAGTAAVRRRLACPKCGKSYRWKDSLRRHQRVECGKEPQHCCPYCLYRFKHRFHLNAHIRDSCPKRAAM
ncbi:hypothetical protein ONE63_006212 [Megalurothrips usitatus]|uniref:C2H2-type domain-containing protein n=1 Tax=Megalurothrips usitatus TaxID=439358 RepID=A0AAV7Y041_9NEOP|nr:hypothetical protein ONE63_006212 [Megalurothrips usitatus]